MPKLAPCAALAALLSLAGCVASSPKQASKLAIASTSLPAASVGSSYTAQIEVSGGTAPYTFSSSGLPAALSIASSAGIIAGTPAQSAIGTVSVTLAVTDNSSPQQTATAKLNMTVNPAALSIVTTALPNAIVGSAYTGVLGATGGVAPYTFAASGLPSGLSINSATGAITGSPALSAVGTASVAFTVTDSETTAQKVAATLSITVLPSGLAITTRALPVGIVNTAYTASIAAAGGTPPYSFSASGLPTGLSISAATGELSGTPVTADEGTTLVNFSVTDSATPTAQKAYAELNLTVNAASSAAACSGMSLGDEASLNGFVPFSADYAWNTDISAAPLDPNNATITAAPEFAGWHLHPNFSSVSGGNYGIPYTVVDSSATQLVPINVIDYASESDVALAPFPANAPIEGSPADCTGWPDTYVGDAHVLVLDRATCTLYETFNTHRCSGQWDSSSETIWDLRSSEQRPWGWTSADAAGLAIFPGLVRYDEVAAGAIHHAIRFTLQHSRQDANGGYFVSPASHAAGTDTGVYNVMGMRIRLKASFDISSYSPANQVILTAMKTYGLILADNGSPFYFQGAPDARWDDNDLDNMKAIGSDNFEVVQMTPSFPGYDTATAPTGAVPTIKSFTASAMSITVGTPVTLTWSTTNNSYDFIDQLGGVHGTSVTVTPTVTTTYTLNATNQFGRTTQQVTITVN
jgi:hypothetical protein